MDTQINLKELLSQAMTELVNNNYLKSIALLTDLLSKEPEHKLALTARGSALLRQGNLASALADFDRAIKNYPTYSKAYHLRGIARVEGGDDDGALEDFDRAIDLDPEYGAAYYSRANLHSKAGEDASMATQIGMRNMTSYANENNLWRTQHFAV